MRPSRFGNQQFEYIRGCKSDMIDSHLLECFNQIDAGCKETELSACIKYHRKLIHQLNMHGKNRYKTLGFLEQYRNSKNRKMGHQLLLSTLNNRGIFRKFLSDKERKTKHWNAKGAGLETGYSDC